MEVMVRIISLCMNDTDVPVCVVTGGMLPLSQRARQPTQLSQCSVSVTYSGRMVGSTVVLQCFDGFWLGDRKGTPVA